MTYHPLAHPLSRLSEGQDDPAILIDYCSALRKLSEKRIAVAQAAYLARVQSQAPSGSSDRG